MNRCLFVCICAVIGVVLSSCSADTDKPLVRTYRMGFQNSAPRSELDLFVASLNIWVQRADAAMITAEVPWDSLLNGVPPVTYVLNNYKGLVDFYRSKNLKLWIYIDPSNGLKREADAGALVARGLSIAQADVQAMYRRFTIVMDSVLKPDHLGLALETNLIRLAAPSSIYEGVRKAANDAAADIRKFNTNVKLSVSLQADVAWGRLGGDKQYVGVAQDFIDFPFIEEVGISSYPYFGFDNPADIPLNYYARLLDGKSLPMFITEGGWVSKNMDGPFGEVIEGNEHHQQLYIQRQGELLDHAKATAVFQLLFTDLDVSSLPGHVEPSIQYFAFLGLVDFDFQPKPALSAWDNLFKRPLEP